MSAPVLRVDDLRVGYHAGEGDVEIVAGVSFELQPGEALGLAGESGCGKTTTALALMKLLAPGLRRLSGTIDLRTDDGVVHVHRRTERGMRDVRWTDVVARLPGRDERARPGAAHRAPDRRRDPPARAARPTARPCARACASCWSAVGPRRRRAATATRTSSRAASASA